MQIKTNDRVELPVEVASCLLKAERGMKRLKMSEFISKSLYEPSMHLLRKQGKLLRPGLVFMGAHALGQRPSRFVNLAMAAELLHVSSLIHDDIIDGDRQRREVAAVHTKYGNEAAILAGDALISKAIDLSSEYGADVMKAITRSTMQMCAGETMDYSYQRSRKIPSVKEYLRIASLKSASLIGTCCNIAAVYTKNRSAGEMYLLGRDLGIAFQIRDDILDSANHTDGLRHRPSIVATMTEHYGISKSEAIKRSIGLNNLYIDSALDHISSGRIRSLMEGYTDFVRVTI